MLSPLTSAAIFLAFALNLVLGLFVYLKNRERIINQLFANFTLYITAWNLTIFLLSNFEPNIWIARASFSFALIALASIFLFAMAFPEKEEISTVIYYSTFCIAIIVALIPLVAGEHFVENVSFNGAIDGDFGPLYYFYLLFPPSFLAAGIWILARKYKNFYGLRRLQIKYLFLGAILFLLPAILTNLLLPALFGIRDFNDLGPAFSFFMIAATSYAIIRYHLMDIWVVVRLGTIYASLFAIVSFGYVLASNIIGQYTSGYLKTLLPSILITFGFIPLKNFIESVTDQIFFRKQFRYQDIIRKFNEIAQTFTFDLNQLLQNFNQLITNDLKASHAAVFLTIPKENFIVHQTIADDHADIELGPDNPIINFLHFHPEAVIERELLKIQPSPHMSDVVSELDRLDLNLVFPIISKEQLIGVYGVGPKKSQDPFGTEEIELLRFFASESGHAIDNARYFEDLKKIDETKSKFISVASHELRTPLTSILWNLEFIQSRNIKNKVVNEMLGHVFHSASFINEHLDDMLVVLNIEEKKDNIFLKKEHIIFSELLNEIIDNLKTEAEKKRIVFDIKLSKTLPSIFADRMKIKKVLRTLLLNAILYNRMGGRIHIAAGTQSFNGQPHFRCSVSDEGMGITDEERGSMYSKFYRSDAARLASPNGFGISLFIAKHFIEAHGGELWFVSSGRGRGAKFELKFPLEHQTE